MFELRHLTFQEYLAALALVDGKFPGRVRGKSLAQHIVPLAGETEGKDGSDIEAVRWAIDILVDMKEPRAVEPLLKRLADENSIVRKASLRALARICEDETGRKLFTRHFDGTWSWLDPQDPVDEERVKKAAKALKIPEEEVRRRYERLAKKYHLKVDWEKGSREERRKRQNDE